MLFSHSELQKERATLQDYGFQTLYYGILGLQEAL